MKTATKQTKSADSYSLLSNIGFLLRGAGRWKKSVIFFLLLQMIAEGLDSYVPLLITKFVIDGIQQGSSIPEFLLLVSAAAAFQLLMNFADSLGS